MTAGCGHRLALCIWSGGPPAVFGLLLVQEILRLMQEILWREGLFHAK